MPAGTPMGKVTCKNAPDTTVIPGAVKEGYLRFYDWPEQPKPQTVADRSHAIWNELQCSTRRVLTKPKRQGRAQLEVVEDL